MESKTVKELILCCNSKKIMYEYFDYFKTDETPEPPEWYEKSFKRLIDEINTIQPFDTDRMIGAEQAGDDLIDVFMLMPDDNTRYGIEFTEWEESLGYIVKQETIENFGLEKLLSALLYEITFFGSTAAEVHEYIVETEEAMNGVESKKL